MQGSELRDLRKQAGLTQAEFGAALHISGAYVGELERGEKPIPPATADLALLLFAHRVSVARFGEKFAVVLTEPKRGTPPGRVHTIHAPVQENEAEAIAAARALGARPGWRYVERG